MSEQLDRVIEAVTVKVEGFNCSDLANSPEVLAEFRLLEELRSQQNLVNENFEERLRELEKNVRAATLEKAETQTGNQVATYKKFRARHATL